MKLIEWTNSAVRDDKAGTIPESLAPIASRLGINDEEWLDSVKYYGRRFQRIVGTVEVIKEFSALLGQRWLQGMKQCQRLYVALPMKSSLN